MKHKVLLLAGSLMLLTNVVSAQAKLVEKVTKKGSELVIP